MTGAATPARLSFKPEQKLRTAADFERVRRQGKRLGDAIFGLHILANEQGRARLGMAVSTRVAGNSVERNRIRRQIREYFRLHQHELPATDLFVTARNAARDAGAPELRDSLARLFQKVARA